VFHLHIRETSAGSRQRAIDGWKQIMGDNLVIVERHTDIPRIIAEIVVKHSHVPRPDQNKPDGSSATDAPAGTDEML
jgi:hypothetical protein